MLPLDHIPFYSPDPDALANDLSRLGFTISPPSRYTAPDHPGANWRGRCVFTRAGWLDLLFAETPRAPGAPASCLFRTPDLTKTRDDLAVLDPEPPFRLERRWADQTDLPPEPFAYSTLRARVAPFAVAVIQHDWPCVDVRPEWMDHANGVQAITGLIFRGGAPGRDAEAARPGLDLSVFEYWSEAAFDAVFPGVSPRRAMRVRVDDLDRTKAILARADLRSTRTADGIAVPAQAGVGCGVLFSV